MKVLVTGGSGFLGSHIADSLSDTGHDVTIFDQIESSYLKPNQKMVCSDILDSNAVADAVKDHDVIYHLAGESDIGNSIEQPRNAIETNILGTLNVLEAIREFGAKRLVFASSIYVYSNQGAIYRTTKQTCEHLIQDYCEHFNVNNTILRFGSLYGPRAGETNGIYTLLSQALNKKSIEYYGSGDEIREYIHVFDAAAMSVEILADEFENQIIHLTGAERMTSREMVSMIKEILGGKIDIIFKEGRLHGHYVETPYNYTPKLGKRLRQNTYIDLGLGLLDCIRDMDLNNSNDK